MAIYIRLGQLECKGDASRLLIESVSGEKVPLAGVCRAPYLPGEEILENFEQLLTDDSYFYLVEKKKLLHVIAKKSLQAAAELAHLYFRHRYLPFRRTSCTIILQSVQNTG